MKRKNRCLWVASYHLFFLTIFKSGTTKNQVELSSCAQVGLRPEPRQYGTTSMVKGQYWAANQCGAKQRAVDKNTKTVRKQQVNLYQLQLMIKIRETSACEATDGSRDGVFLRWLVTVTGILEGQACVLKNTDWLNTWSFFYYVIHFVCLFVSIGKQRKGFQATRSGLRRGPGTFECLCRQK